MATSTTADVAVARASQTTSAWARNRDLLGELLRRDLKARYRGSSLGILWSLFNPLIYMAIYSVVFSNFVRIQTPGAKFPVFLLAGLLGWNFFLQAVTASLVSVIGNAAVVKKVAFPWVLLTLSAVLAALVNYVISLVILLPVVLILGAHLGLPLVTLPLMVLITLALTLGLGLLVAAGNVYFRDVEYLVGIALQIGFFLTPIIYPVEFIQKHPDIYRFFKLNPMLWIAISFQDVIAYDRWPRNWLGLAYAGAFAAVMLVVGILVFDRLQVRFAEEL